MIFSQNETLLLQARVTELESRLARYEPVHKPLRKFENYDHLDRVCEDGLHYLRDWLDNNVRACAFSAFDQGGMNAVCDIYIFMEAIEHCVFMITGCKTFSNGLSSRCLDVARAACQAAHYLDEAEEEWCADEAGIVRLIMRSLDEFISDECKGVVEWPDECPPHSSS